MSRGYVDKFGDHYRARYVQSPYNARDLSVPRNKVIFDTDDIGTLSLLASGSYTMTYAGSIDVGPVLIGSWADPGYIPLCEFHFAVGSGPRDNAFAMFYSTVYTKNHRITVSRTGITASLVVTAVSPVHIYWNAYRLAVA